MLEHTATMVEDDGLLAIPWPHDAAGLLEIEASRSRGARQYGAFRGRQIDALPPRPGTVLSLAFCGPTRLAAGGSDNLIRLWDLTTRAEQLELVGHTGSVTALVWDARSDELVSGSFDTTVRFWQLKDSGIETASRR